MSKQKSIMLKILIPVSIAIILSGITMSFYNAYKSINKQKKLVKNFSEMIENEVSEKIRKRAESLAGKIESELNVPMDVSRTLGQVFSLAGERDINRELANDMLKQVLIKNEDFIDVYTVWEPNAFDGKDELYANKQGFDKTGQFYPDWVRDSSGKIYMDLFSFYKKRSGDPSHPGPGEYFDLLEQNDEVVTDPHAIEIAGKKIVTASLNTPVFINSKFSGAIGVSFSLEHLQELVSKQSKEIYNGAGSVAIVGHRGLVTAFSNNNDLLGEHITNTTLNIEGTLERITKGESYFSIDEDRQLGIYQIPIKIGKSKTPWSLFIHLPIQVVLKDLVELDRSVKAELRSEIIFQVVFNIIVLLIAIVVIYFIIKKIVTPIKRATRLAKLTAKGIFDKEELIVKSNDEVGVLIDSMNSMVRFLHNRSIKKRRIAEGDLTVKIELASKKDEIGLALSKMVKELRNIISKISNSIHQVNEGADQISESSQTLSQGSAQQASSLEEITASLNEISAQIQEKLKGTIAVSKLTEETKRSALEGTEQMEALVSAMNEIDESANNIKTIVEIIDDISFQTNLLALNADIEAARVGKYGKGFAVVANSVRTLAVKSQSSVKETTEMVEQTIRSIKKGVELVEKTSAKLNEITEGSVEITRIAKESVISSKEQAKGIEQISIGISSIEEVVQSNSANAEENAASSEELASQAKRLKELISYFKTEENILTDGNNNEISSRDDKNNLSLIEVTEEY